MWRDKGGNPASKRSAAALSYLIQNSRKPIVITGAQKPIDMEITDAKTNLSDSLRFASCDRSHGVNIVFDGKVIAGVGGLPNYETCGYYPVVEKWIFLGKTVVMTTQVTKLMWILGGCFVESIRARSHMEQPVIPEVFAVSVLRRSIHLPFYPNGC